MPIETLGQPVGQNFFCHLLINDQEFVSQNILSLTIYEWVFDILQRIELVIYDEGYLTETFPIEDNQEIYVEIGKHEDDQNPIEATFIVSDYKISMVGADNRKSVVEIGGFIKVGDMFTNKNRSFANVSSQSVLRTITNEAGLSFVNPNGAVPRDVMTWYQINQSNFDFIKHVLKRSNILDDVAFFYSNLQNKFIYTSLRKEMDKLGEKRARFDLDKYMVDLTNTSEPSDTIYYNYYDIVNCNGYFNKKTNYGTSYSYYDLINNVDQTYDDVNRFTSISFQDQSYRGQSVHHKVCGMLNERNLYDNYFESKVRNDFLLNDFFAYSLVLNINAIHQVDLFDIVNVIIPSTISQSDEMAETVSGKYLVGGITHQISTGGIYSKRISLHRNGMDLSPYMGSFNNAR